MFLASMYCNTWLGTSVSTALANFTGVIPALYLHKHTDRQTDKHYTHNIYLIYIHNTYATN
jgi:hypothetical protein